MTNSSAPTSAADAQVPDEVSLPAGATLAVVQAARDLTRVVPQEPSAVAKQCLLDWLGVALAGASEPLTVMLTDELTGDNPVGEATLVGRSGCATAPVAALVNGAAAHALDFDDMHFAMSGHPTASVAAAALALGERLRASGAELVAALVAGVEVECRLGLLVNPSHYELGWHATGTLGTFGAAAACASLLDLGEEGWLRAFGLAGTQAAGLNAVFGTMGKPLHAGKAAMNGLLAATLAMRGFTCRPDIIEADQGFAATHAQELADVRVLDALSQRYLIRDTLFKYHAACYWAHAAIDCALELRDRPGLSPADVTDIEVEVSNEVIAAADIAEPRTGLEGKFSVRTLIAMALLGDDTANPLSYSDARMAAPELVELRKRVRVIAIGDHTPGVARLRIATRAGQRYEATANTSAPATELAHQRERVAAKFTTLATPLLGADRAEQIRNLIDRLDELQSVGELTAAYRL
ncbi:MAG: MmgE/PrpD family protein [Solirubrobacteraceae bacterium]